MFVTYLCADDFGRPSPLPTLANNENEVFDSAAKVFECNHEEGHTRIICHALQQKTNVVVCPKDTDALVLMVFVMLLIKLTRYELWKLRAESVTILGKL